MINLNIFCCSHFHNKKIEMLKNIIPAGTGNSIYPDYWFNDNSLDNISRLNSSYAELTFHYWVWKNHLDNFSNKDMIGFCQYRRFWLKDNHDRTITFENLNENLLNVNNSNLSQGNTTYESSNVFSAYTNCLGYVIPHLANKVAKTNLDGLSTFRIIFSNVLPESKISSTNKESDEIKF